MSTLLGQKIGMTQIFAADGATVPVTLIRIPEVHVIKIKTVENDGYSAIQFGTNAVADDKEAKRKIAKPQRGHLKESGVMARKLYEVRIDDKKKLAEWKVGQELKIDSLTSGDAVQVRGTSKGRGFAGVVKRYHFRGGPASHGGKHNLRQPGAIGAQQPQHVIPGRKMAGHMGDEKTSVKNLEVVQIDPEKRIAVIKGSVPGALFSWVGIYPAGKKVSHPLSERKGLEAESTDKKSKDGEKKGKK